MLLLTTPGALAGTDHTAPSRLDGYGPVSSFSAQQLCCDAEVTVVTQARNGAVLDVGRTRRFPTTRQRHAGGATDLDNLVLLCQGCRTSVRHFGWTITTTADGRHAAGPPPDPG